MTHKITCKEDLYNTYIKNTPENRAAMIAKCKEFGILDEDDSYEYTTGDYLEVIVCCGDGMLCWANAPEELSTEITLEDLIVPYPDASQKSFTLNGYTYTTIPPDLSDMALAKLMINEEAFNADGGVIKDLVSLKNSPVYTREKVQWWETCTFPVLCWVSDTKEDLKESKEAIECIRSFEEKESYPFRMIGSGWKYATPLTKEDIQLYLNNVPEGY